MTGRTLSAHSPEGRTAGRARCPHPGGCDGGRRAWRWGGQPGTLPASRSAALPAPGSGRTCPGQPGPGAAAPSRPPGAAPPPVLPVPIPVPVPEPGEAGAARWRR